MDKDLPLRSQIIYKEYVHEKDSDISIKNELKLTFNKIPYNLTPLFAQIGKDLVSNDPYQILPLLFSFLKTTTSGLVDENLAVNNDALFKTLFTKEIKDKYDQIVNDLIELYNILNINEIINKKLVNTKLECTNNTPELLLLDKYRQLDK